MGGERMAFRLGRALSSLPSTETRTLKVGVHSSLQRARQTAQFASESMLMKNDGSDEEEWVDRAMTGGGSRISALKLKALPELGEVDFGPGNEGKPAAEARGDMYGTFGAWAIGKIDTRPRGGGETGRE